MKIKAIELSLARKTVKYVTQELDVPAQLLSVWRKHFREYQEIAFPGNGNIKQTEAEKEFAALSRELREVTMEHDLLKKVISLFSKSDRKNLHS